MSTATSAPVLALFAEADRDRVQPVLDALTAQGLHALPVTEAAEVPADQDHERATCALLFISPAFAASSTLQTCALDLDAAGVELLPVQLEAAELPELLSARLMATNAVMAERYPTPDALAERLASSELLSGKAAHEAQTATHKRRTGLIVAAVAIVVAAIVFVVSHALGAGGRSATRVAESYGMTQADLENIRDVIIVGEHLVFYTADDIAQDPDFDRNQRGLHWGHTSHTEDDDGTQHWYWNEDGSETTRTTYDLSFLTLLPNLEQLSLVNADISSIPNLASLEHLDTVMLYTDQLPEDGLAFLAGSSVRTMDTSGCGITDYSQLNACEYLEDIYIDTQQDKADLTGFAPPALKRLAVEAATGDLSSLSGCTQLEQVELMGADVQNLNFLEGRDTLKLITLEDCGALTDASALATCTNLEGFYVNWSYELRDLSFLESLPKLRDVSLFSVPLRNFNFLVQIEDKDGFMLGFCPSEPENVDWSGLSNISHYGVLHVNPSDRGSVADILPHIADATIDHLYLRECEGVDLSALPHVRDVLSIDQGNLTSLTGLDQPELRELRLIDLQLMTTLEGIEGAPNVLTQLDQAALEVSNCPRLTDWSAIANVRLRRLELKNLFVLPDFATLNVGEIRLENIYGLADLACFDAMDVSHFNSVELVAQPDVRDLSPLARFRNSTHLTVPPQLADQAAALVEDGVFLEFEVDYSEGGAEQAQIELLSLDELDTLPPALLGMVEHLRVAGGTLFDWQENTWYEWDEEAGGMVEVNGETDERTPLGAGTLTDLARLAPLTGLRELVLFGQPITSLDGLQGFEGLEQFQLNWCPDVTDFTPIFACPNLRGLHLPGVGITSVEGIQNLTQLEEVTLSWNQDLADLTPLLACPSLTHVRVSSDMEAALASLDGLDYGFEVEIEQAGD